jgi:sec-independent protein translocase protein TatA
LSSVILDTGFMIRMRPDIGVDVPVRAGFREPQNLSIPQQRLQVRATMEVLSHVLTACGEWRINMEIFQPWHLIIVALVAVLLFGGRKLPELGKGLGEGLRGFKEGMKGITDDAKADVKPADAAHTVTPKVEETPK